MEYVGAVRADDSAAVRDTPRFAAIGRDEVELRRVILLALLLALRDERDLLAGRRPRGLAVFLAAAWTLRISEVYGPGNRMPQYLCELIDAALADPNVSARLAGLGGTVLAGC